MSEELDEFNKRFHKKADRLEEIREQYEKTLEPGYEDNEPPWHWYQLGYEASDLESEIDYLLMQIRYLQMIERQRVRDGEETSTQEKL